MRINKQFFKLFLLLFLSFYIQGCVVGTIVAAPFKVVGETVNLVTPDIIGDSISTTGDVLDMAIPF